MNTLDLHADILMSDLSPGAKLCSHCGRKGRFGTLLNKMKKKSLKFLVETFHSANSKECISS